MATAPAPPAQLTLDRPDLVPGHVVRFRDASGWRFGLLVGIEGGRAVVTLGRTGERVTVAVGGVRPWPPVSGAPAR